MEYEVNCIIENENLLQVLTGVFIGMPLRQVLVREKTTIIIGPEVRFEAAVATVERIIDLSPTSQAWFEPA